MIKSTIALITTLFTLTVFLSPATADTEPPVEKEKPNLSSLIIPVHDTKTKKSKNWKTYRSEAQKIRAEKYLDFECAPEDNTCENPYNNEANNPDYNTSN